MRRLLVGTVLAAVCLAGSGCMVVATVAAAGALVVSSTDKQGKAVNKAPAPAVETPAQPATAPMAAAAPTPVAPTGLTAESAAGLAQPGQVVVADAEHGTRTSLPWQDGMTLAAAVATGKPGDFHAARIFRGPRVLPADLRQEWTAALALLSGDVVELRR